MSPCQRWVNGAAGGHLAEVLKMGNLGFKVKFGLPFFLRFRISDAMDRIVPVRFIG